jgi:hypothetical protein
MAGAAEILGMPWYFSGELVSRCGDAARLKVSDSLILPPRGVYLVERD